MAYNHLKLEETHEFSSDLGTIRYEVYCQYDGVNQNLAAIKVFELKNGTFHYNGDVSLPKKKKSNGLQQVVGEISAPVNQIYQSAGYCREHYIQNYQ